MKIGLIEGFFKSFFSIKDYPRYRRQSGFKVFIYLLFLTFLISIVPLLGALVFKIEAEQAIEKISIPEWSFQGDKLSTNGRLIYHDNEVLGSLPEDTGARLFIIDSNVNFIISDNERAIYVQNPETSKNIAKLEVSDNIEALLLAGRDSLWISNSKSYENYPYANIPEKVRVEFLSYDNIMGLYKSLWLIAYGLIFVCLFISVLFGAFVQTLIACVQNKGRAINRFGHLFKMSVYARTLPTLIVVITTFFGFAIPFGFIINYIIGGIYTGLAIKKTCESDLIDRTAELNSLNGADTLNPNDYNTPFNNGNATEYNNQQTNPMVYNKPNNVPPVGYAQAGYNPNYQMGNFGSNMPMNGYNPNMPNGFGMNYPNNAGNFNPNMPMNGYNPNMPNGFGMNYPNNVGNVNQNNYNSEPPMDNYNQEDFEIKGYNQNRGIDNINKNNLGIDTFSPNNINSFNGNRLDINNFNQDIEQVNEFDIEEDEEFIAATNTDVDKKFSVDEMNGKISVNKK